MPILPRHYPGFSVLKDILFRLPNFGIGRQVSRKQFDRHLQDGLDCYLTITDVSVARKMDNIKVYGIWTWKGETSKPYIVPMKMLTKSWYIFDRKSAPHVDIDTMLPPP